MLAVDCVVDALKDMSKQVTTPEEITQVDLSAQTYHYMGEILDKFVK